MPGSPASLNALPQLSRPWCARAAARERDPDACPLPPPAGGDAVAVQPLGAGRRIFDQRGSATLAAV
ncbi:MAG: hypothetical protein HOV87_23040 [Catenulispora sp.]|nr:hypothetical protein [Catenulispora sp.]